jgi:hypothetical protein
VRADKPVTEQQAHEPVTEQQADEPVTEEHKKYIWPISDILSTVASSIE